MPRTIQFTKMHGLGNDYVYVDGFAQALDGVDRPALARIISDRHRGVGSDGMILILPPDPGVAADCRMEMYNADGSRGEMCGNGIRCVAKYVFDHGLLAENFRGSPQAQVRRTQAHLRVQTDRGILDLTCFPGADGGIVSVRVNMGAPILDSGRVPVAVPSGRCVRQPLQIDGQLFQMTCLSMGNPHAVFFIESLDRLELPRVGPLVERHPLFPNRVNAHFVVAAGRGEATMKTWERGSGITQACGTGACAVLVAGVLEGRLDRCATLHLPGGDLEVEWPEPEAGPVFMTGPAEEVFSGQWHV